jgi:HlyD family secretion protein
VVEVRSTPTKSNGVVTYQTVLSVDNSALLLKPGMTATAEIIVDEVINAVLVPNAALRFTPPVETTRSGSFLPGPPASGRVTTDDPATRVWTLVDGLPRPIDVTVGASNGQTTQVSGPVQPGDAVIVDIMPERD